MFHPIGSQAPSVYWRRRLLLLASLILLVVLIVLTATAVLSGGSGNPAAAGTTSRAHTSSASRAVAPASSASTSASATAHASPSSSARGSAGRSSTRSSGAASATSPSTSPSSTPSATCVAKDLRVVAVAQKSSYRVGDRPVLQLQVTDVGAKPCVQDLGDPQVELKVYNGESRVWGSHDCKTVPGASPRTLLPNVPVLVAITWSGLTSQVPCTTTRQRVGAGTYTLYGSLSGRTGRAGRFTIS